MRTSRGGRPHLPSGVKLRVLLSQNPARVARVGANPGEPLLACPDEGARAYVI